MGYLAAKTETIEIGSAILNVYSRTPGALLQTAAGLDNVSGGRAILGLGASGPQVIEGFHGVPYSKPLARTAEVIDIVRRGLKREKLENDGLIKLPLTKEDGAVTGLGKALKILTHPERDTIPIYIASLGAEVRRADRRDRRRLDPDAVPPREGAPRLGRCPRGRARRSAPPTSARWRSTPGGMVAIGEGPETKALLDFARPLYALYVGGMGAKGKNFYNDVACAFGYEKEAEPRSRTSTSPARRRRPRRSSRPSGSRPPTSSAPRPTSRSGSRRSRRPASPTCPSPRPPTTPPPPSRR